MTFSQAILYSLARSGLIAAGGLLIARCLSGWLQALHRKERSLVWLAVLIPYFTPGLVVGYCYRDTVLSLSNRPIANELLYSLLVAAQAVPFGVILLHFAPPPAASESALQCARLARGRSIGKFAHWWALRLRGDWGRQLTAVCGMFLLSFQENELASLVQARTWTEWLFTKQAAGLINPLPYLFAPVAIQMACLLGLARWLTALRLPAGIQYGHSGGNRMTRALAAGWILLALMLVTAVPILQLLRGAWRGGTVLWLQPSLPFEIGDALLVCATATVATVTLLVLLNRSALDSSTAGTRPPERSFLRMPLLVLLCLPGLMGPLCLGLLLALAFQTPLLAAAYDTPLPLLLGEVFYLLPRGLALWGCLLPLADSAAHLPRLMTSSVSPRLQRTALDLRWTLRGGKWFWVTALLAFWSYMELTLPSLLAAPGMTPIPMLLYHELHYGRIAGLAAKLVLTLLIPALLAGGVWLLRRPLLRWFTP